MPSARFIIVVAAEPLPGLEVAHFDHAHHLTHRHHVRGLDVALAQARRFGLLGGASQA
jgi:hypothetical protein